MGEWTKERDDEMVRRWPWVAEDLGDAGGIVVEVKGSLIRDLRAAWLAAEERARTLLAECNALHAAASTDRLTQERDAALARVAALEALLAEPSEDRLLEMATLLPASWSKDRVGWAVDVVRSLLADLRARAEVDRG